MSIIIANFGKYAISDCPFICLSVRNFFDTGHSFLYIFTKLDPSVYLCHVTMPIVFRGQRSNNEVTRSKSRSNFEIVITQSIFELELRSNAQNVGYWTGYLDDIPIFR